MYCPHPSGLWLGIHAYQANLSCMQFPLLGQNLDVIVVANMCMHMLATTISLLHLYFVPPMEPHS